MDGSKLKISMLVSYNARIANNKFVSNAEMNGMVILLHVRSIKKRNSKIGVKTM